MLSHVPLFTHWSFGMSLLRRCWLFRPVALMVLVRLIATLCRIQGCQLTFTSESILGGIGGIT
jgi:hypothetical protein